MGRGAVIVRQESRSGPIVRLETLDKLDRRPVESVDVLVVVTHGKQAEFVVLVGQGAAGQGRDQLVLLRADVLVFVHEYPAETGQQPRPLLIGVVRRQPGAPQQVHRLPEYLSEGVVVQAFRAPAEAGTHQPHGKAVTGEHGHASGVVAEQFGQTATNFYRGMAIIGKCQNATRVFAPHAQ